MPILDGQVVAEGVLDGLDDHVVDLKGVAVLGEPIVGVEVVTLDGNGPGVRPAIGLPSPNEPTPAARAAHNLTHAKYETWCPYCVASRRPNDQHRVQHQDERDSEAQPKPPPFQLRAPT